MYCKLLSIPLSFTTSWVILQQKYSTGSFKTLYQNYKIFCDTLTIYQQYQKCIKFVGCSFSSEINAFKVLTDLR